MMSAELPPVIFLMGPTATGKTDLAIALRDHLPVELISVDSALIYRGMDIGTAKPDAETLARVPHHLIDIRDPAQGYSAAEFAADVKPLLRDITAAGRIPLLVGGTMLYFRVLREGLGNLPGSDSAVRDRIEREAEERGWPALHAELAAVDPETAAELHPNHSQRIQRALEIYRLTGRPASELRRDSTLSVAPIVNDYRITQIALLPHRRQLLHERIADRFGRMLAAGLIDEVEKLRERGDLSPSLPSIRAVGYRQVWDYLAGDIDYDTLVARGVAATRQLAKRQLTWLRGWPGVYPLYIDDEQGQPQSPDQLVANCLNILGDVPIYS